MGGKGSGVHSKGRPEIAGESPYSKTPERNGDAIEFVMALMSLPQIDLADPGAVEGRLSLYLEMCAQYNTKPLISGLCSSIGCSRAEVMRWGNGQDTQLGRRLSPASGQVLQKFLENLEVLWEFAMQNDGYRNPVTGIFIGKNNFNYKDTSETVIRHEQTRQGPTREQLAAKYQAALPAEDVVVEEPAPKPKKRRGRPKKLPKSDG